MMVDLSECRRLPASSSRIAPAASRLCVRRLRLDDGQAGRLLFLACDRSLVRGRTYWEQRLFGLDSIDRPQIAHFLADSARVRRSSTLRLRRHSCRRDRHRRGDSPTRQRENRALPGKSWPAAAALQPGRVPRRSSSIGLRDRLVPGRGVFHMDEYLGLAARPFRVVPADTSASTSSDRAGLVDDRIHLILGESTRRAFRVCLDYETWLRADVSRRRVRRYGENGHFAFNDPFVADFFPRSRRVKVVRLDHACRIQQVHDGCFARIDDVPTHAYTLTIPAPSFWPELFLVVVLGLGKAAAVFSALPWGPFPKPARPQR